MTSLIRRLTGGGQPPPPAPATTAPVTLPPIPVNRRPSQSSASGQGPPPQPSTNTNPSNGPRRQSLSAHQSQQGTTAAATGGSSASTASTASHATSQPIQVPGHSSLSPPPTGATAAGSLGQSLRAPDNSAATSTASSQRSSLSIPTIAAASPSHSDARSFQHTNTMTQGSTTGSSTGRDSLSDSMGNLAISGDKKKNKKPISYAAEKIIGQGAFGVVYLATVMESGETVAIKKILQDKRFKNRELQIMAMLDHPSVITLKHCFYSKEAKEGKEGGEKDVYLNLVMQYIPETIYRTIRNHTKANKYVPIIYAKLYMYQICRSLSYIHSQGICHRDVKPQNLLLNSRTHEVKLCDFGSAKVLVKEEANVAYICSRYYRAPELVLEAQQYTNAIDVWSVGCVMGEILLGHPLFAGESAVDQLVEIIKVLGTPTREEVISMNPAKTSIKFPDISPRPWFKVFRKTKTPPEAIDLLSKLLRYTPTARVDPFEALAHQFFDELRQPNLRLPNGKSAPELFNFTEKELKAAEAKGILDIIYPEHVRKRHAEQLSSRSAAGSSGNSSPHAATSTNNAVTAGGSAGAPSNALVSPMSGQTAPSAPPPSSVLSPTGQAGAS